MDGGSEDSSGSSCGIIYSGVVESFFELHELIEQVQDKFLNAAVLFANVVHPETLKDY